jgi:hypothetical protein
MLKYFRHHWGWIFLLLVIGLMIWLISDTASFQACVGKIQSNQHARSFKDEAAFFYSTFVNYVGCTGQFLDAHGGAITALAALIMASFTALLWISTDKLWVQTLEAGRTARISADAASKNANAALLAARPWLTCNVEIAGPLVFDADGDAVFRFKITVRNIGKSPAMSVRLFPPQLSLSSSQFVGSNISLQRLADLSRGLPARGAAVVGSADTPGGNPEGAVLFPDAAYIEHHELRLNHEELVRACEDVRPAMQFWPELVVLVTYLYQLADVRGDTGFVYEIIRSGGVPFQMGEGVPAKELRIEPHRKWSGVTS